jgi:hypothetical protein
MLITGRGLFIAITSVVVVYVIDCRGRGVAAARRATPLERLSDSAVLGLEARGARVALPGSGRALGSFFQIEKNRVHLGARGCIWVHLERRRATFFA